MLCLILVFSEVHLLRRGAVSLSLRSGALVDIAVPPYSPRSPAIYMFSPPPCHTPYPVLLAVSYSGFPPPQSSSYDPKMRKTAYLGGGDAMLSYPRRDNITAQCRGDGMVGSR